MIDNVEVKDYLLDIHFAAQIERPLLNGIIVESLTPSDVKTGTNVPNEFKLEQNFLIRLIRQYSMSIRAQRKNRLPCDVRNVLYR